MSTMRELDDLERLLLAEAEAASQRRLAAERRVRDLAAEEQRLQAEAKRQEAETERHVADAKAALIRAKTP